MGARQRPAAALQALAGANARFWPTVYPHLQRELASWQARAGAISDPHLRALALHKLHSERFNAEVAATLATLAPRAHRPAVTRAIVALELLFDYLDGRTEALAGDPAGEGARLFAPFLDAVRNPVSVDCASAGSAGPQDPGAKDENAPVKDVAPDWGYLKALCSRTQDGLRSLPGAAVVRAFALASAQRCAEAQLRLHALPHTGRPALEQWAAGHCACSGLEWREYVSGSASSVLAVHALIAAAADPACTETGARKTGSAYLAIAAVITILDSIADHAEDTARGDPGFIALFEDRSELEDRLRSLIREALARAWEAPNGAHHAMTLAGVAAYYTTHPAAGAPAARPLVSMVRRELSPTIWPTLALMRSWRAAKLARARAGAGGAAKLPIQRPADVE